MPLKRPRPGILGLPPALLAYLQGFRANAAQPAGGIVTLICRPL